MLTAHHHHTRTCPGSGTLSAGRLELLKQEVCPPSFLHGEVSLVSAIEDSINGGGARISVAGKTCVGGCDVGSGLTCGGRVYWQGCGGSGGGMGSGHDSGASELGCCEESELACRDIESLRRLDSAFFFFTFFMVVFLE